MAQPLIVERCVIEVRPGTEDGLEQEWPRARALIESADGCVSARLLRGVETPATFLLLVEWESVEAHMEGFRNSELFGEWRSIVGPFFAAAPEVEHFSELLAEDPS